MEQYIIKDAVVAEIEKRITETMQFTFNQFRGGQINAFKSLLKILDTLEVKDVDLKNELKEDWLFADKIEVDCLESMCLTEDMFASLAKKYFELGINTRKI